MAVGDSQLHIQASPYYSPDKIFCFEEPECMLTYHVSLLLKKNSALETDINRMIRILFEAGILSKWKNNSPKVKQRMPTDQPLQMTMENLLMPLIFILGIGLPLALLIFLGELIVSRKMKQPSISPVWFLLNQMFDPDRKYLNIESL